MNNIQLQHPRFICQLQRRTMSAIQECQVWRFFQDNKGFYCLSDTDLSKLTAEQYKEYQQDLSCYPGWLDSEDSDYAAQQMRHFPTLALAFEYAKLVDEEESISEDLDAFHAPSECYRDAFRGFEVRFEAILRQAV